MSGMAESNLLNPVESAEMLRNYWRESRRPLVSLAFVSPLLVAYEGGILLLGPQAMRNGAAEWMKSFLQALGFGQYFLLPMLTVGLLLAWHHTTRERWYVPVQVLYSMAGECFSLALVLVVLAFLHSVVMHAVFPATVAIPLMSISGTLMTVLSRALGFFGAGIYEEVLFRLMMLPALIGIFKLAGVRSVPSIWGAITISSLLFSLAHYVGPRGDTFDAFSFIFRFVAGAFFAVLFVKRGFGIVAGTHALYDILVGVV
jgi:membrane protease YdiL (CAAX protease family)